MARGLGVDIFTAVSWRGVRVSGVLESCSDGKVVATQMCVRVKVGELDACTVHVKDGRLRYITPTLTLFIPVSFTCTVTIESFCIHVLTCAHISVEYVEPK
jgi:hypothetical protein